VIETECRAPQRGPGGLHIGNGMAWDVLTPPSACFLVLFTCCLFVVCGSAFYTNRSTPLTSLIAIAHHAAHQSRPGPGPGGAARGCPLS
jgi:hypothetical protein